MIHQGNTTLLPLKLAHAPPPLVCSSAPLTLRDTIT